MYLNFDKAILFNIFVTIKKYNLKNFYNIFKNYLRKNPTMYKIFSKIIIEYLKKLNILEILNALVFFKSQSITYI